VGGEWKESEAGDLVREVVGRVAGGESCQAVAADLLERAVPLPRGGRWCAASVVRIVRCEAYSSGQWVANKGVAIAVPVLVDPTLAAAARARLAAYRLRGLRRTIHHWLLEAIARCGVCDSPIRIHGNVSRRESKTHNYWYYVCERNRRRMPGGRCSLPSRRADLLDAEVWATVVAWIEQPDLLRSGLAAQSGAACDEGRQALADLDEWRRRAGALVEVELEALRLRERGLLSAPALAARLGETARKRALLERQIATAEGMARDASAASIAAAGLATAAEDLRRGAARADRSERQRLVRLVCDAWTIDETEVRGLGAIGAATRELVVVAR
jgi:hypothetical protein